MIRAVWPEGQPNTAGASVPLRKPPSAAAASAALARRTCVIVCMNFLRVVRCRCGGLLRQNLFRRSFRSFPILAGRLAAGGLPRSRREAVRMDARKRIAAAVKDHLARERISREQFAFKTSLGKSTIEQRQHGSASRRERV